MGPGKCSDEDEAIKTGSHQLKCPLFVKYGDTGESDMAERAGGGGEGGEQCQRYVYGAEGCDFDQGFFFFCGGSQKEDVVTMVLMMMRFLRPASVRERSCRSGGKR